MQSKLKILKNRTMIMGVMNLTPDSFSGDGRVSHRGIKVNDNIRFALNLAKQGADIIDVGAESSRPNAKAVSVKQELKRLLPHLAPIVKVSSVPISVDTYKPEVALAALDVGVSLINCIHGAKPNKQLLLHVRDYKAYVCLMHSRGDAQSMGSLSKYKDLITDVINELSKAVDFCMDLHIKKDKIIIDPGFGFAKTPIQNLALLNNLDKFKIYNLPILVGTSRKSFIGKVIGKEVGQSVWGTAATITLAIERGANIVRVHDVGEMKQVAQMTDAVLMAK